MVIAFVPCHGVSLDEPDQRQGDTDTQDTNRERQSTETHKKVRQNTWRRMYECTNVGMYECMWIYMYIHIIMYTPLPGDECLSGVVLAEGD